MPSSLKKIIYLIYDLLASLIAIVLLPILKLTRRYKVENFPIQTRLFQWFGIFPISNHYYEPKFVYEANFDASKPRDLPISINTVDQIAQLQLLANPEELAALNAGQSAQHVQTLQPAQPTQFIQFIQSTQSTQSPQPAQLVQLAQPVQTLQPANLVQTLQPAQSAQEQFNVHNPNFGAGDAELYYLLIRDRKPKRIIEIGSGFSTKLSLLAIEKNKEEGFACELTCIEPFEMPFLDAVNGITVIRKQVETLPLSMFQSLERNDILFIDSSHIIRPGDDVLFIFFQVLPILQKGVLIQIHDIFTPRHYPQEWLTKKMRFWNEQYLLEAFLTNNEGFKILFAANHLVKTEFEAAKKVLIHLKPDSEPSSFWMQRV